MYIEVTPVILILLAFGVAGILFLIYMIVDILRLYRRLPEDKRLLKFWFYRG